MQGYHGLFLTITMVPQMIFALLFEDNEEHSDKRMEHMEEHINFLIENTLQIHAAGPLINAESKTQAGGLWLVEVNNLNDAQKLIEKDPFWPTGLRKKVQILEWNQVFADGKRLIA